MFSGHAAQKRLLSLEHLLLVPVKNGKTGAQHSEGLFQDRTGRGWSSFSANGAGDVRKEKADGKQMTSNMAVFFSKQKTNTWSNKGEPEQLVTSSLQQEKKGDYVKCGLNFEKHYH